MSVPYLDVKAYNLLNSWLMNFIFGMELSHDPINPDRPFLDIKEPL